MKRLFLPFSMLLLAVCGSRASGHLDHLSNNHPAALTAELVCPPPTNLASVDITATSVVLQWDAVVGASGGYQVQIRVAGTDIWATLPANTNELAVNGLLSGTTYQWRVRSICDPGGSGGDFSEIHTFTTLQSTASCPIPADLSTTNVTATSAQLNWSGTAGVAQYEVQIRVGTSTVWTSYFTTSPPYLAQNLAPATVHHWRVRSICSNTAVSDWSNEKEFVTLSATPDCPAPTNLHATNITATSAVLSWSASAGALGYQIDYQTVGSTTWTTVYATGGATSVTLTNLSPLTGYIWRVRAKCDSGIYSDWSDLSDFKTLEQTVACPHPGDLSVSNITATSATLSWSAVAGALGYEVNYQTANGAWVSVTSSTNSITVTGLSPNTQYFWRVRAKCDGAGLSDWSAVEDFWTLAGATCPVPTDVAVSNVTATSATISWNAVAGALGYEVNYAVATAGTPTWISVFVAAPSTSVVLNNLTPLTGYLYRVRTKCDGQIWSDWSTIHDFKTQQGTSNCLAPVDLAVTNVTATSATFSWNAAAGALGYEVNYQTANGAWQSVFVAAPATSVTVNGLTPATAYNWRVRTKCDGQVWSDWSVTKEFKTLPGSGDCKAPGDFGVKDLTAHSAILVWNAVSGAVGYEVQIRKIGAANWQTYTTSTNSLQVNNLSAETDYEWRVRTICDPAQSSDWSAVQHFLTPPDGGTGGPCDVPGDFTVSDVTHHSAKLSWSAAAGAFSYQIAYRAINSSTWKIVTVTGNPVPTMYVLDNLAPNTTYEVRIRSHCGPDLNSDWSDSLLFTTLEATPCGVPTDLQASNITYYNATLSWTDVPGAVSYRVRYRKFGTQIWKTKTITGNPPAATTTVAPLPANSTIEWQVKTFCGGGSESDWSALATFQTLATPPCDAPTGLNFTDIEPTSAVINWNGTTGALSYRVRYRKISPNGQPGPWKVKLVTGTPPPTSVAVDGLTPNSTYEVQVRALCGPASQSVWSVTASFFTPPNFTDPNGPKSLVKKQVLTGAAVAPNPTAGLTTFRFQSAEDGQGELTVVDLNGRAVFATQLVVNQGLNEVELSLGELVPGLYALRLQGTAEILTEKIQIVR